MRYARAGFLGDKICGNTHIREVVRCGDCYALVTTGDEHDHDAWHTDQNAEPEQPYGWSGIEDDINNIEHRIEDIEKVLKAMREALA